MEINWPAIRAFDRLFLPVAYSINKQAWMDSQIDGGEWSGPAADRVMDKKHKRYVRLVAERFKIPVVTFGGMLYEAEHEAFMGFIKEATK